MSRNKKNRQQVQANKSRKLDRHEAKVVEGTKRIVEERTIKKEDYYLSWFKPTSIQKDLIYSICTNELTLCQAGSGCGKSTTAIYQALSEIKRGLYKKLVFIKTPSEAGSDTIGYLTGDANQKLVAHMDAMRSIFHTFMSKNKLEMEEKRGLIEFSIPNFCQGKTFYNSIIIVDEAQLLDQNTIKMILERIDDTSKLIVLGDIAQRYSAKKRQDGFTHFIKMVTEVDEQGRYSVEDMIGYIEMTAEHNMRGKLSKRIGQIYEAADE